MFITSHYLVYPDGEIQEVDYPLAFDDMVDINGQSLRLPLATHKIIAYRVSKIIKKETRGEDSILYHLELVSAADLMGLVR